MIGDAEPGHRIRQFDFTVFAKRILEMCGSVRVLLADNFTLLTQGAGDKSDVRTFGDVFGHRGTGADGLVIRMGVNKQESAI
jgi:hypothetical protein